MSVIRSTDGHVDATWENISVAGDDPARAIPEKV